MSEQYDNLPLPSSETLTPEIKIRLATKDDINGLAHLFFRSFTPSHPFWEVAFPKSLYVAWWIDAWRMGIEDDKSDRTYIAVDTSIKESDAGECAVPGGRVVAFTRWIVPQHDGNLHRPWPDLPDGSDMDVLGRFFDGMDVNREHLMGSRPHWFLELLGTDQAYQGKGLGSVFVKWGCDLADKQDMQVYIDASANGAPFYQKHFDAQPKAKVELPRRPETYGEYTYVSHVRPSLSERQAQQSST